MEKPLPNLNPAPTAFGGAAEPRPANRAPDVSTTLASLPIDIGKVVDPVVKQAMTALLNLVERQATEIATLRKQNQELRDEINRLKGEQGKPDIKPNHKAGNISSEEERRSR